MDEAAREQALNILMIGIAVIALVVGLLSMLTGRLVALYDWLRPRLDAWLASRAVKRSAREAPVVMSRRTRRDVLAQLVAPPVAPIPRSAGQPIATPDNRDNDPLSRQPQLSDDARDIIRFQAKVEALASLYNAGQVSNLAKGIEEAFGCSRSSKEDSPYQRARRAVDLLIVKQPEPTPIAGRPTPAAFPSDLN